MMLLGITLILFSLATAPHGPEELQLLSILGLFLAIIGLIGRDKIECSTRD